MKKRAAALVLSLVMGLSSVSYGADVFSDPAQEGEVFPVDDLAGNADTETVLESGSVDFEDPTLAEDVPEDEETFFVDEPADLTETIDLTGDSDLAGVSDETGDPGLADEEGDSSSEKSGVLPADDDSGFIDEIDLEDVPDSEGENVQEEQLTTDGIQTEEDGIAASVEEASVPVVGVSDSVKDITVDVSDWVQTPDGWKLKKPASGETTYYSYQDGFLNITTKNAETGQSHTACYLFDIYSIMLTGRRTLKEDTGDGTFTAYFVEASKANLYDEYAGQKLARTPYNSNFGARRFNYWYYSKELRIFRYFDESGREVSMDTLLEQNKNIGYFKIRGKYYLLDSNGMPQLGERLINSEYYYFKGNSEIPGQMFTSGWKCFTVNGKQRWVYYKMLNAGAQRGQAARHGAPYPASIPQKSKKYQFLLNNEGFILKKAHVQCENGKYYGSDSNGRIRKNQLATYDGEKYYFTEDGSQAAYQNQWVFLKNENNQYYYFGNTPGKVDKQTGICKVTFGGNFLGWYYFDENGKQVRNQMIGDRFFDESGRMVSGIYPIGDQKYFFQSSSESECNGTMYKSTLIHYQDHYYYANYNGTLFKEGTVRIDGIVYYFVDYKMQFNTFTWNGDTYGYVNSSGKFVTGWVIESNSNNLVRYVNPSGGGFYTSTSAVIDGYRYYFDSNGYRRNDVTDIYTGPYYVRVDRVNGVMTVYDSSRTVPVKSIRVSVGLASTPTPTGTYTLYRSARWQALMGPSWGQYGTHVYGAGYGGIFVHSIACTYANSYNVPASAYNMLGYPASHGCIRCCVADAKWVYDHCNGATITIFDGSYNSNEAMKGPLGRRALVPMTGSFDPTDPAV